MPRLSIRLLGPFEAALEGSPRIAFESDRARALLAYLAVERRRPHARERLSRLLWPDLPERAAERSLRAALATLRRLIRDRRASPRALSITRQAVQLDPRADVWCDVDEFSALLEAVGRPQRATDQRQEAMALYRGPFLEGLSLPDSVAFTEWLLLKREQFEQQAVRVLLRLSRWHERRGEFGRALRYARRRVRLQPWGQEGQRQVMRLLALSGERDAALVHFRALRRRLVEERGVEPEAETTTLHERIRDGRTLPSLASLPPHNLPSPATPFVGREDELDRIHDHLSDPDCRLLTLLGPGGCGKTRLALEAAGDALLANGEHCPRDGVFWVSLARLRAAEAIAPAVTEAVGLAFGPRSEGEAQLLAYLRRKRALLVLDGFEHLLDGASWVRDLLRAAPDVRVLATSRAELGLEFERLLHVQGLALPDPKALDAAHDPAGLLAYDALALFVQSGQRVQPGFSLTARNAADVTRICRLAAGTPLAIVLAAASLDRSAPGEIAARLAGEVAQGLDLRQDDWQDAPERQRGVRAVFEHAWRLLDVRQKEMLLCLSVPWGGFTAEAARQIASALPAEVDELLRRSLLTQEPEGRYAMHELLRELAGEKRDQGALSDSVLRDRHCAYYIAAVEGWGADLRGPREQAALAEMAADIANAQAAWEWAAEGAQVERLGRAAHGLGWFYRRLGRFREGEKTFHLAADRLAAADLPPVEFASDRLPVLTRVLAWQGFFASELGQGQDAVGIFRFVLDLLQSPQPDDLDLRPETAFALLRAGDALLDLDAAQGRLLFEQALTLCQQLGDRQGVADALYGLGKADAVEGDEVGARSRFEECLSLRRTLGDRYGIAEALLALSGILSPGGEVAAGVGWGEEGLAILQELGLRADLPPALSSVGSMLASQGQFARALAAYNKALALCLELGQGGPIAGLLAAMGHAEMHLGRYERARERGQRARTLAQKSGNQSVVGSALFLLGSLAVARGAFAEGYDLLRLGAITIENHGQGTGLGPVIAALGYAARGLQRPAEAWSHLLRALHMALEPGAAAEGWSAMPGVALLLVDDGQPDWAVEWYAMAMRDPVAAGSQWVEDIAGRQIAAAVVDLDPGVAEAVRERGRQQTLEDALQELENAE